MPRRKYGKLRKPIGTQAGKTALPRKPRPSPAAQSRSAEGPAPLPHTPAATAASPQGV